MFRVSHAIFVFVVCFISACVTTNAPTRSGSELVLKDQPEREVKILIAYGNGVSKSAGRDVVSYVATRLHEQTNVKLKAFETEALLDSTPTRSLATFMRGWKKVLTSSGEQYDIVHLFLPHKSFAPASSESALGYAEGVGVAGRVPNAFSYTRLTGDFDMDTWAMLHEIGHLLGATHASSGTMRHDRLPERLYYSADSLVGMLGDTDRLAVFEPAAQRNRLAFTSFKSY